ncbi:efflux RND transporter periplasmic adaptor subunit [Chryseotalea sanaruensis]|uniref:Efflux RND transporter periplasmic adaptor subunit n=1 Tax=Chryseotalea sanaruensis TaxID=2482724 RepID=A0A401UEQ8_9BACT|nr:efflux RND transporter periplasmic adaptor subunit [Chryseotalea sanaruensis]GCC53386.1 efflux RND transporter periplasmic adaptor subunit [Chryseotalea sanaruensis]
MKNTYISSVILLALSAACSAPPVDDLTMKKQKLDSVRTVMADLKETISQLEREIRDSDPAASLASSVLVKPVAIENKPFEHFIDVRGTVESRKNILLSAVTGGEIERVHVTEGQRVTKDQLLVSLDAAILRSSIAELKSSLDLAKTIFEKQEKLWKQNIGTEVQYLQAKNTKEGLEKKLNGAYAQLDQMLIKAPFSGTIDRVDALEGQMASPGLPLVRMVSQDDMYIKADVSEEFIGKLKTGDKAEVYFPVQDKKVSSIIASVGQVINPENRTFSVEVKLSGGVGVNPNQVTLVTLRDYVNNNTFSLPTKYIQRDNNGQFVYIVEMIHNQAHAKKAYIKIGQSFNGNTEILEGLVGSETVIGEGFRDLTDGAEITLATGAESKVAVN